MISIILPVYNCEKYVAQAINSILNQSYQNLELLICDDGSTDASNQVINRFKDGRIRLFRNEKNIGSLRTRNFLFKQIKGDFVALQDADDYSDSDRLALQYEVLNNTNTMLCGTWAKYFKNGKVIFEKKTPLEWAEIRSQLKSRNPFCSASIFFRRNILDDIGDYREYFLDKGNYDYDFTARITEKFPCVNIKKFLYNVRININSNSKRIDPNYPIKLESHKIVQFLINERCIKDLDSLECRNELILSDLEKKILHPYTINKLLVYDKHINLLIDSKLHLSAFLLAVNTMFLFNFSLKSIQLFLYTVKRLFHVI